MARCVYEVRESGYPEGKMFGQPSGATKYLRENFNCSFPSGSVGQLKEGSISQIQTTGKRDGEKVYFVVMRHEVR